MATQGIVNRRAALSAALAVLASPVLAQAPALPQSHDDHAHHEFPVPDIMECLRELGPGRRFAAMVAAAGLERQLQQLPQVTVFVPVDEAIPDGPRDVEQQRRLVRQHVMPVLWDNNLEVDPAALRNLNGVPLRPDGGAVNGAAFVVQGIKVRNGVVHIVSGLIA